jgi:hypothetical protein
MNLLNGLAIRPENPGFLNEDFCQVIETLLPELAASNETMPRSIDPATAARNRGDFHGLLNELGVDPCLHYAAMRINGYASTFDYDGEALVVYIPSTTDLNRYYSSWTQSLNKLVSA